MSRDQILALEKECEALRTGKQYEAAIDKAQEILKLDPQFVRAHLALAVLYEKVQKYQESCQHAEQACALEPSDSFNFAALSVTYQRAFEGTRDPAFIEKAEYAMARSRGM